MAKRPNSSTRPGDRTPAALFDWLAYKKIGFPKADPPLPTYTKNGKASSAFLQKILLSRD